MASIIIDDIRMNENIERGAKGGPEFKTSDQRTDGGFLQTNQNWQYPLSSFDVGFGIQDKSQIVPILDFYMGRRGKARGFRYKDWNDYEATTSQIGVGDAAVVAFQLVKVYPDTVNPLTRKITRPVSGTVRIFFDAVEQLSGFTVDHATGIVTFSVAPGTGVVITATFEFDLPCRFADDKLELEMEWECAIEIPEIIIEQVRE